MARKGITTTLTAPGERVVKSDGKYIGMVVREKDGWHRLGKGSRIAYRTFTLAAQALAERVQRQAEAEYRRAAAQVPDVRPGQIITLRSKADGIETRHLMQALSFTSKAWTLYLGGLGVPYTSDEYEFVSASNTW